MSPKEAVLDALKRVARNFDNDEKRLEEVDLNFYALRKDGEYCRRVRLWGRHGRAFREYARGDRQPSHVEQSCVSVGSEKWIEPRALRRHSYCVAVRLE